MSLLTSFAPWLVLLIVTDATDWRFGLAAGVVTQLAVLALRRPRRIGVLDVAMIVFFVGMGTVAVLRPDSRLEDVLGIISMSWLALVAAGSILVGHPFTLDFSRDGVTPEVARSTLFLDINRTIAWAWAGCFAATAMVGVVARLAGRPTLGTVGAVLLVLAAIRFTKQYPDRAAAAAHATHDTTHARAH